MTDPGRLYSPDFVYPKSPEERMLRGANDPGFSILRPDPMPAYSASPSAMPVTRFRPKPIARHVIADYQLELAGIHGPAHWLRVRTNGLALARRTPGADTIVIEAFALLHDARRIDDFRDLGHGERAADFARALHQRGLLGLTDAAVDVLADACAGHEHGQVSDHPTIGCCWDADRLDLSRLERRPIEEYLSTRAARDARVQRDAWRRGMSWHIDARGAARWGIDPVSLGL